MTDQRTIDVYNNSAQDYAARFSSDKPDAHLQRFADALKPNSRVLDLGCGHGSASAELCALGHDVLGLDASQAMLDIAAKQSNATFQLGSFDEINTLGRFDAVWANFALLHAARDALPRHLSDIRAALPDGGLFHIGMKTGTGAKRDAIDRRYTYVTQDELSGLLTKAGFDITHMSFGEGRGLDGTVAPWVVILAKGQA